jgi:predicted nucleotidyltransferase
VISADTVTHIRAVSYIKDIVSQNGGLVGNIMVSGAHMYGFPSENSDIDYRGFFILRTNPLLGLDRPTERVEANATINDAYCDIVIQELKNFCELLWKMNCNTLEHLFATPLYSSTEYLQLKDIISHMLSKNGILESYKGMAEFNYKKFILTGKKKTVKKYLYVYRAMMAGIHALRTGEIEPDLNELNKHPPTDKIGILVDELLNLKKMGVEDKLMVGDTSKWDEELPT